jgi:hypothetical protein
MLDQDRKHHKTFPSSALEDNWNLFATNELRTQEIHGNQQHGEPGSHPIGLKRPIPPHRLSRQPRYVWKSFRPAILPVQ